jgi:hypothetical protein
MHKKILLIGSSHAVQFAKLLNITKPIIEGVNNLLECSYENSHIYLALNSTSNPLIGVEHGRHVLEKNFASLISDTVFDRLILMVGGNEHNIDFLAKNSESLEFVNADQQYMHSKIMDKLTFRMRNLQHEMSFFVSQIQFKDALYIAAPPPIPDESYIINNPEGFRFEGLGLYDKYFRLHVYQAYVSIIKDYCLLNSLIFYTFDNDKLDDEGFFLLKSKKMSMMEPNDDPTNFPFSLDSTLVQAIEQWKNDLFLFHRSRHTVRAYVDDLFSFLTFYTKNRSTPSPSSSNLHLICVEEIKHLTKREKLKTET